ncbi:MAG: hypothetical protein HYR85_20640 [Planctomycetes bacterium]|nr:hypothetical protein [Planctomycetota bacterium]MBI3846144.1 hypothetical protein [Planctomycetota bacterium]
MLRGVRVPVSFAVVALIGLAGGWTLHAQTKPDEKSGAVKVEDLPPSVRRLVDQFGEGGKITKAARAKEDGLAVFQIVVEKDGRKIEVQTTLEGRLFSVEEKIATSSLPPDVLTRAKELFADEAKIHAERAIVGLYEISGEVKGKRRTYLVNEAGAAFRESRPGVHEAKKPAKSPKDTDSKANPTPKKD